MMKTKINLIVLMLVGITPIFSAGQDAVVARVNEVKARAERGIAVNGDLYLSKDVALTYLGYMTVGGIAGAGLAKEISASQLVMGFSGVLFGGCAYAKTRLQDKQIAIRERAIVILVEEVLTAEDQIAINQQEIMRLRRAVRNVFVPPQERFTCTIL